jgi:hypothetical protein
MNIKIHLDAEEYAPIARTAAAFGCEVEDVVYVAVNLYMLRLGNFVDQCGPECKKLFLTNDAMRAEVLNTKEARKQNLPQWADSAGAAHNYEGRAPEQSEKSSKSAF